MRGTFTEKIRETVLFQTKGVSVLPNGNFESSKNIGNAN